MLGQDPTRQRPAQPSLSLTGKLPQSTYFSFANIPQSTVKILPDGLTIDTLSRDDYSFYSMWTEPLIDAVATRTYIPLHYFRSVSPSELTTKLATAQRSTAFLFDVDGKMVTTQTFGARPRPIRTHEELLDCIGNLHRLETRFRSPLLATREVQTVSKWAGMYALEPLVEMLNQVRAVRMYNRKYDSIGVLDPEFDYLHALFARTSAVSRSTSSAGSGSGTSSRGGRVPSLGPSSSGGGAPSTSSKKPTPASKRGKQDYGTLTSSTPDRPSKEVTAKRKALSASLREEARAKGFCIFFQTDTCDKRPAQGTPHQVQPRDKSRAPFDVLHQCAKCEAEGHGAASCPNG